MDLNKLIEHEKWDFYVSRKFNWFVQSAQIKANSKKYQLKYLGFSVACPNYLILNGDEYSLKNDSEKLFNSWKLLYESEPKFFTNFAAKIMCLVELVKDYTKKIREIDFSTVSNDNLLKQFSVYEEIYVKSFIPAWSRPDDFLEKKLKKNLLEELRLSEEKATALLEKIAICLNPNKLAYLNEPVELMRLAKIIQERKLNLEHLPDEIKQMLEKHKEKYSWLKEPIGNKETDFSIKEYLDRIHVSLTKNIKQELKFIQKYRKKSITSYHYLLSKYSFPPEIKKICEAIQTFIFLRTYSTETSDYLFYTSRKTILKEIACRLRIPLEDLVMLDPKEMLALLNGEYLDKTIIKKRKEAYAIIWEKEICTLLFGTDAKRVQEKMKEKQKKIIREENYTTTTDLKGRTASIGKVKGTVKILFSYQDVNKVNSGDILVATMTTPDYVLAMEKAAGFITDEGGITCHAAIIAREFHVPCVVGTKIATIFFKDGDWVELDADNGIVRKIIRN